MKEGVTQTSQQEMEDEEQAYTYLMRTLSDLKALKMETASLLAPDTGEIGRMEKVIRKLIEEKEELNRETEKGERVMEEQRKVLENVSEDIAEW